MVYCFQFITRNIKGVLFFITKSQLFYAKRIIDSNALKFYISEMSTTKREKDEKKEEAGLVRRVDSK